MDLMSLVPNEIPFGDDDLRAAPRIVHNCKVPKEEDEIDLLIEGNRPIDKIKRWFIRKRILSKNHPTTKIYIKSSAAINYEIGRHIRAYRCTIYPFSDIRSFWEKFMNIFTILSLLLIPLILAFDFRISNESLYVIFFIDFVFAIDVIMWFYTGHYDNSTRIIILDRKIIASKYLKGFFVLDFLSTFPFEVMCVPLTAERWYCSVSNLTKILRLRTIVLYSRNLRYLYKISFQKYKIYEMSTIIIICIHWATCLELYVALVGRQIDSESINHGSWLMSDIMKDKDTNLKIYLACANRATVSLVSSSHYLEMKTTEDILLNLLLTVVGRIGFIYMIAQFLQLMTTFQSTSKRALKLVRQLHEYMQYKELPLSIQRRLLDYYKYCNRKKFDRDKYIIDQVSPYLREELLLHNYSRLIDSVDYFRHLPQAVAARILRLLKIQVYLTNDVIVKAGTPGDALFFIASGTVAVYTNNGKEVCHLEDGSHFGEVSLVMENEQRTATVVAVEICQTWVLKRSDFLVCISPHPNLLNHLQRIAVDRLEKNLLGRMYKYEKSRLINPSNARETKTRNEDEDKYTTVDKAHSEDYE